MTDVISELAETETWRWDRGLAYWVFALPSSEGVHSDTELNTALRSALASINDFAQVCRASWSTATEGEDALVLDFDVAPSLDTVADAARALQGVTRSTIDLDLNCVSATGVLRRITDGAQLDIERDPGGVLAMTFSLNVDVFAVQTWGRSRDNHVLAALNASRLNAFLTRLREATRGVLQEFDPTDYPGQFLATGVTEGSSS